MVNMVLNVRAESFMMGEAQGIKWQLGGFSPNQYILDQVVAFAEEIDRRYLAIREMTCPDY